MTVNLHRDVQPKLKVWVLSTKAVKPAEGVAKPAEAKKSDAPPKA